MSQVREGRGVDPPATGPSTRPLAVWTKRSAGLLCCCCCCWCSPHHGLSFRFEVETAGPRPRRKLADDQRLDGLWQKVQANFSQARLSLYGRPKPTDLLESQGASSSFWLFLPLSPPLPRPDFHMVKWGNSTPVRIHAVARLASPSLSLEQSILSTYQQSMYVHELVDSLDIGLASHSSPQAKSKTAGSSKYE